MDNIFRLGYYIDTHWQEKGSRISYGLVKDSNADIMVYSPEMKGISVEQAVVQAKDTADEFHNAGLKFLLHCESCNWSEHNIGPDGHDWYNRADGGHRLNWPPEVVRAYASVPEFLGVMHDEMEHAFINRNLSITLESKFKKRPLFFPLCKTENLREADEYYVEQFRKYADEFLSNGSPYFIGEHVFPVLFHMYAKAGITPTFKSQKESYSNIQAIIAGGAALEYNTELWNCIDMWFRQTYPGHSPKELASNLEFSYLFGVNLAFVEGSNTFYKKDTEKPEYNEYGNEFVRFSKEYSQKDRGYSIRDYRPRIGIIRMDDSFWGQNDPLVWQKILYGNPKLKPDKRSYEWLRALNLITHKESSTRGVSWDKLDIWSIRRHRSFASMNSPAVFDDEVKKETLESLELCFLCGCRISDETLKAVGELVNEKGLTVVAPKRFAPETIKSKIRGSQCEISDGSGKWIITNDPASQFVNDHVGQFLGNKGEMSFRFTDREIRMKISDDGETFTVL